MSRQRDNGAPRGPSAAPPRDAQFWVGWLAAGLVVLIIVAVAALAWQQLRPPAAGRAEVAMTPIVGGMTLVTATPTAGVVAAATPATPTAVVITVTVATLPAEEVTVEPAEPVTPTVTVTATAVVVDATTTPLPAATATPANPPTATLAPTATPAPTRTPIPTPAPTFTPTPVAAMRVVFAPDDQVVSQAGRLAVYAQAAADAPVLDSVGEGVPLTVLEPSGDYTGYPVIAGGHGWVRVRAADGLVGWVVTDTLALQP